MADFFSNIPPDDAVEIEQLSRLLYEVRTARQALLAQSGAADEAALLERIARGATVAHPAYEHYLSVRILGALRDDVRADLNRRLNPAAADAAPAALHLDLAAQLERHFGECLDGPVDMKLDALLLRLDNGVVVEARFAATDAYAIAWTWGDAEMRIDTAPHTASADAAANHRHTADGRQLDDPVTRCDATPWDNLRALLDILLDDPLLSRFESLPTAAGDTP